MDNFTSLKPSIRDYFKSNITNIELNYFIRHSCFSFHSSLSFYLYKAQAIGNRSVLTILGNMLRTTKLLSSINVRVELLLLQYTVTFLGILYTSGIFIVSTGGLVFLAQSLYSRLILAEEYTVQGIVRQTRKYLYKKNITPNMYCLGI